MSNRYVISQLDEQPTIECSCGVTRRAFLQDVDQVASVHFLKVTSKARRHYHKQLTEIYIIIEGSGYLELDEDQVSVKPNMAVMVKPGCRHRAVGNMTILNIVVPAFNPEDEWFE